jgi:hypothetical protein
MRRKTLVIRAVATALAAAAAPSASAYTGTSEAKSLSKLVISNYKKVPAITTRESGDVFYCASVAGGFLDGPSAGCRSKAVAEYTRLLKKGKVIGAFGKTSAHGKADEQYDRDQGDGARLPGARHRRREEEAVHARGVPVGRPAHGARPRQLEQGAEAAVDEAAVRRQRRLNKWGRCILIHAPL